MKKKSKLGRVNLNKSIVNVLVGRKKVEWVAYNHKISEHAKMQMVRRGLLNYNLTAAILNTPLVWKLPKGYIAIALNLYEYVVVAMSEKAGPATIVTYVNLSNEGYSVIDKMLITYQDEIREKGLSDNGLVIKV